MDKKQYDNYLKILREELIPALGCTEPIALAYAASYAREVLGESPKRMEVRCSGNIIKNVKGVTVPNSGGMKGIEAAAVLGVIGGRADRELEVLCQVTGEQTKRAQELLNTGFCKCFLEEGVEKLYIHVRVFSEQHTADVLIEEKHTAITRIVKDGKILFHQDKAGVYRLPDSIPAETEKSPANAPDNTYLQGHIETDGHADLDGHADRALLNVRDILCFADSVRIEDIKELMERQIQMNMAISDEGLKNHYGAEVGRTLLEVYGNDMKIRAKARAAAGSDARMNGCSLPVVINSGSGNQGMTCSLPVVEFAKGLLASQDKLYRALVVSNLIAVHQKKYIGSLSAYCGAVSAACGAGAGITYLYGGDYQRVSYTITNTIANVGGIVCDGAKSSCAAKIASAVDAAIMAHFLGGENHCFHAGEGLVQKDVEETIRKVGYVGKVGMKETDTTILNLMLEE